MRLIRGLFLSYRFFIALLIVAMAFVYGFVIPIFFVVGQGLLVLVGSILALEIFILFGKKHPIEATRHVMNPLSLGDQNKVKITVQNNFSFTISALIYDNAPAQLQLRDLSFSDLLEPEIIKSFTYEIRPTERGEYKFSDIFIYVSTLTHFAQRKVVIKATEKVATYPSIIQMKQYELKVFAKTAMSGIKKIRRLGHNNEFEQIKN